MKEIDFMTREEMIDVIETLAWRVAVAENSRTSIIDSEMVRRVLEEEGDIEEDEVEDFLRWNFKLSEEEIELILLAVY